VRTLEGYGPGISITSTDYDNPDVDDWALQFTVETDDTRSRNPGMGEPSDPGACNVRDHQSRRMGISAHGSFVGDCGIGEPRPVSALPGTDIRAAPSPAEPCR